MVSEEPGWGHPESERPRREWSAPDQPRNQHGEDARRRQKRQRTTHDRSDRPMALEPETGRHQPSLVGSINHRTLARSIGVDYSPYPPS
jgi:hypothetical protein